LNGEEEDQEGGRLLEEDLHDRLAPLGLERGVGDGRNAEKEK